jgi:hypothetical protein
VCFVNACKTKVQQTLGIFCISNDFDRALLAALGSFAGLNILT